MTTLFPRTPPRLDRIYVPFPLYFVTICTHARQPILNNAEMHARFADFCLATHESTHVAVGRYVLMPDHLHLFVSVPPDRHLSSWAGRLKQALTKVAVDRGASQPVWQRGFFDHLLRSGESYGEKWSYVRENPVRAGLVPVAEDWPYAGEIILIRW